MNATRAIIVVVALITISSGFAGIAAGESATIGDDIDTSSEEANILVSVSSEEIPGRGSTKRDKVKEAIEESQKPVIEHFHSLDGVAVNNKYWISNTIEITVNTSKTDIHTVVDQEDITHISANEVVSKPEPPETSSLATTATHDLGKYTYGLKQTNAPAAWEEFNVSGDGTNITIIDTGVYIDHSDITLKGSASDNYKGGWAVFNKSTNTDSGYKDFEGVDAPEPQDDGAGGHGTHVSGTATGGDATGTHIGVAPNASLQHAMVFDYYDTVYGTQFGATESNVIRAIEWAVNNDADVISLSLGGDPDSSYITPTENARQNGVTVIASSGNDGDGTVSDPAAINNVTAIGATDSNKDIASYSGGDEYDPTSSSYYGTDASDWDNPQIAPFVVAPGSNVYSADDSGSTLESKDGTSMAAPHVAGASALLIEQNPTLTPTQVKVILAEGAVQPNGYSTHNTRSGQGIINITNSLAMSDPHGHLTLTNSTVNQTTITGDNITAEINVTNENIIGDSADRNVTFSVNGSVVAYEELTVNSNSTKQLNFSYATDESDSGTVTSSISTENDSETYQTSVGEESNLNVSLNTSTLNKTIVDGQNETFSVTLNNTGGLDITDDIDFYINESLAESRSDKTVTGGANTTIEFTFEPDAHTSPVQLKVNTSTDNTTYNQTVEPLGTLNINTSTPDTADQGTSVSLEATYNITSGINRTITPTIEQDGSTVFTGEESVLNATGSNNVSIQTNESLPSGETSSVQYNFSAQTDYQTEESVNKTISINKGAVYYVSTLSTRFDDGEIPTKVKNKGSIEEEATINITQNGTVIGSKSGVSLSPGQSTSLTIPISIIETGTGELRVVTPQTSLGMKTTFTEETTSNNDENTNSDDESSSGSSGGGGGGAGGGGGGGGSGSGPDNSPPAPQDVKDTLNFVDTVSDKVVSGDTPESDEEGTDTSTEDSSSESANTVQSVEFSDDTDATVTSTDYGEPPQTFENELVNSISIDQEGVKAATPDEVEWESEDSESEGSGSEDSSSGSSAPETATEGNDIDVVAVSDIKSEQEIDESDTTASVTVSVDSEDVSDPDQLTVYKEEYIFEAQEVQWIELDTTATETNNGKIDVTAEANGFSLFTVAEVQPDSSEATTESTENTTDTEQSNDSAPGFGAITALVSLLLIVPLLARRRNQ